MVLLIISAMVARLGFAAALGLGIDESYMVAAGRHLQLGYFDHPPAAWWLSWAAAWLTGSDAAVVVRMPFIALFAVSTWLVFRLGARLYDRSAGFWAAVAFNLSPVFGLTTGSWVLPDGPLDCALLGAALCLSHALEANGRASWGWWLGTGLCAGLSLLSKYTACLTIAGAVAYLLTQPAHRRWLRRPEFYAASLFVLLAIGWILAWNAAHGWTSIAFQGERAVGFRFRPLRPLAVLAGEALFVLPWIWVPLTALFLQALRRGPTDARSWMLACLGAGPILLFPLVAVWSAKPVLFHWAAPGYLMLFPALGGWIARRLDAGDRVMRGGLAATAILLVGIVMLIGSEVRWNWLPEWLEQAGGPADPDLPAINWTSLRSDLAVRDLLGRPGLFLAGTNWQDCGKLDYAIGRDMPVICLTGDPREFGISAPEAKADGRDVLVVARHTRAASAQGMMSRRFTRVEPLPDIALRHGSESVLRLSLFLGHALHPE